jgi:DNA-directed RNA polymerase specialized sigma24 family protein
MQSVAHIERTETHARLEAFMSTLRAYVDRLTRGTGLGQEVMQETCLRILRADAAPVESTRFSEWCLTVARNAWAAERRKSSPRSGEVPLDSRLHAPRNIRTDPEQRVYANEKFAHASSRLDAEGAELLVRRYVFGERITDLAGERGQRPATLRMRFLRLRSTLRAKRRR